MNRRSFLQTVPVGVAAAAVTPNVFRASARQAPPESTGAKGAQGYRHSVCRWCYGSMDLAQLARSAKAMGISSVELLGESEWRVVQGEGITCALANGPTTIPSGFNRIENHDRLVIRSEELLPKVKAAGIPSMIVFSGNRAGLSDAEGLDNCVTGLKRVAPLAEAAGVTIVMELLNSKVDHMDYMCDRTAWGVELVKRVASDRFRLLYDIYHMQIMEGDVIRTIGENAWAIGHYHTGGVPGRAEIDATQELNYPAICRAINGVGYTGYIAQEFIPRSGDPMRSLAEAVRLCTVGSS